MAARSMSRRTASVPCSIFAGICVCTAARRTGATGVAAPQLALALAADVLGDDEKALDVYQRLKYKLVGGLPHEGWVLTKAQVRATIETIEQDRPRNARKRPGSGATPPSPQSLCP